MIEGRRCLFRRGRHLPLSFSVKRVLMLHTARDIYSGVVNTPRITPLTPLQWL
jgi:hypothetical protein